MADGNAGEPTASADTMYVVGAYLVVVLGVIGAILLAEKEAITIKVTEGFAPFAVIYIVAQAIERLLQPISGFAFKAEEKEVTKTKLAQTKQQLAMARSANESGVAKDKAAEAAAHQKKLKAIQADRAVAFWAVATFLALLASGALELGLIQSVANVTGKSGGSVPDWFKNLDIVITGIAIGSGTKPLHDLIGVIQNAKQKSESSTATT
jgi:hypothetical protein